MEKIYRNGLSSRESAKKILTVNLGVIGIALLVALIFTRMFGSSAESGESDLTFWTFVILGSLGVIVYIYLSLIRLLPLAEINGNTLTVYTGVFIKKTVDLDKVEKITFQYSSEKDQRMKVKYPRKIAEEFTIKQSNCSVKQLSEFITNRFDVNVAYT
ncbi:hypothetical protein QT397_16270 [Microbulbifer sp. MKSA007]|uniref:hypothetical protein n=1 Tax=unclassified Microbulbifer TaxID=2619833 RepID=UPI002B303E3E|nr:hypothetical protein QT397_16270 [Microbulbifer sp. MKSA007]